MTLRPPKKGIWDQKRGGMTCRPCEIAAYLVGEAYQAERGPDETGDILAHAQGWHSKCKGKGCGCGQMGHQKPDTVNHPSHYKAHPSGVECIEITESMNFCLGNVIKYVWRAGLKDGDPLEDLEKASWYLTREIERLKRS